MAADSLHRGVDKQRTDALSGSVLHRSTQKMAIAGIVLHANGLWMSQVGCNATDAVDGILKASAF